MAPGASTLRLCLRTPLRYQRLPYATARQLLLRAANVGISSSRRNLHATACRETDSSGENGGGGSSNSSSSSSIGDTNRLPDSPEIESIRRKFARFRKEREREEKPLTGLPAAALEEMEKDMVMRARMWPMLNYDPASDPDKTATRTLFARELRHMGHKYVESDLDALLEGELRPTPELVQATKALPSDMFPSPSENEEHVPDSLPVDNVVPSPASLTYHEMRQELEHLVDGDPKDFSTPVEPKPDRNSYWFDEDDDDGQTHDVDGWDTFNEDDIMSVAHGKLDELREQRHYARLAAWEMPLLSKLAKPFELPTNEQVLRFRYTTYLGEFHPAERKVVVQFSPGDLGLTPAQELKMKKLAGPRFNPEKDFIKMSCESFDHQAQNKRYLLEQVDRLIAAAKDPTDMFEDIPLDLRHYRPKKRAPKFPEAWDMTPERVKEIEEFRQNEARKEQERVEQGAFVVDGKDVVQSFLGPPSAYETEDYVPLMGKKYIRIKGGRQNRA